METIFKFAASLALLLLLLLNGCVWSENPVNPPGIISITINKPLSNDTIGYKNIGIDFSVIQDKGIKFFQLYMNGELVADIIPSNGKVPTITLPVDSSSIGKRISFYICYYDNDGGVALSDSITNVLIAETHEPPFKPYNFALKSISNSIYNLSWKDSSAGNTWFEVFRRSASGAYSDNPYLTASRGAFNINDESIDRGTVYYYKMRSVNQFGYSGFTNEINTLGSSGSVNIAAPSGLQATATSPKIVKLTWIDNSNNENFFGIERKSSYSDFVSVAYVSKNSTAYTDSSNSLASGGEYYYRVKAYSSSDSSWSSEVHVQTPLYSLKSPTITSLTNPTSNSVVIKWAPGDSRYVDWEIYRRAENESEFTLIADLQGYLRQYTDTDIIPNKKYYYKMLAKDASYTSVFSAESTISTSVIPLISPKFTLYYYTGGNKINLTWEFNQPATRFIIERKDVSVTPAVITLIEVDGSLRSYDDHIAACNKSFEYRIKSVDKYTESAFSTSAAVNGGCW